MNITLARRSWFDLGRHDLRTQVAAAIRAIIQNGLVEATFRGALTPDFLFPLIADREPVSAGVGDTITKTRRGLLTPTTTGLGGNTDPSPSTYAIEQFSLVIDQYGGAVDTNLLQSAIAAQKKYLEDVAALGTQAAQSLNRIARARLYAAYGGGVTFVPTGGGSSTTLVVDDANGFDKVLVNGVPTTVSATNPLSITINGVANTVVGCNLGTNTLTLGTTVATTTGWVVAAANAPYFVRPNSRTSQYSLVSGDVATMASFRAAVTRLRQMSVPTVDGYYVAHIDAVTEGQLFADADFKQALQGRVDSPVFTDMSIGRFSGIDWVRNVEAPATTKTLGAGSLTVRRSLVCGAGGLIGGEFADEANLLDQVSEGAGTETAAQSNISLVEAGDTGFQVAMIVREPQDRLQQVVGTAWSWVGDFCVPSDSTTGDAALYKRGVVVETIGS